MFIRWQNSSESFKIYNGVRQGGLLSSYPFRLYIRNSIDRVTKLNIGCNYFGINFNLLAYADDMVLLAPPWFGLEPLLNVLEFSANEIFMSFSTKKTVAYAWFLTLVNDIKLSVIPSLCSVWQVAISYLLRISNT